MEPARETVVVTNAGRSLTEDRRLRTRRYLITQGIRVACVLLAVLLPVATVWKIGFIGASIVLPWLGVVAANAGPAVDRGRSQVLAPAPPAGPPGLPAERTAIEATKVIDADR